MHKILLLDTPVSESYHSLLMRLWVSHLTNTDLSFLIPEMEITTPIFPGFCER